MKTAIVDGPICIHHFDLIRINTRKETRILKKILHLKTLRKECYGIWLEPAYPKAREYGYNTRIEFVAPTQRFFEILKLYEKHFKPYKITYIELARDKFVKYQYQKDKIFYAVSKYEGEKYTTDYFIKTQTDEEAMNNDAETLTRKKTGYFLNRQFQKVIYPRISIMDNKPCIQTEYRISGAKVIKKITGIETIDDLMNFDIFEFWINQTNPPTYRPFFTVDCNGKPKRNTD